MAFQSSEGYKGNTLFLFCAPRVFQWNMRTATKILKSQTRANPATQREYKSISDGV